MKRLLSILLCTIIMLSCFPSFAKAADTDKTANYLIGMVKSPTIASVGGEWTVLGLARSGADVPRSYFDTYYANVTSVVKKQKGVLHERKYTEYSRVVIALTATGRNPENVSGYDLVKPLCDYSKVTQQGINGALWALIALDCGDYGNADIRNKYVDYFLSREKKNGGWSLSASSADPESDITAMVLTALSRYTYRTDVKNAVGRGVALLSKLQNSDGGYSLSGEKTSESTAQVLVAISSLGISCSDNRFVKNGNSLVVALMKYQKSDGSFSHTSKSDLMATEQCFYALAAKDRLMQNKTSLFDMSDVLYTGVNGKSASVKVQPVVYPGRTFGDIKESKYRNEIEKLSARGIINGLTDTEFRPDKTMTRAEFSTIVVRALGLGKVGSNAFSDVSENAWYKDYVATAYKFGIVNGVSESRFDPEGTITVEQACIMIERAGKLCGLGNTLSQSEISSFISKYSDSKNVSSWARSGVAYCASNKFLYTSSGALSPKSPIKRGEVAYMLYGLLKEAKLS